MTYERNSTVADKRPARLDVEYSVKGDTHYFIFPTHQDMRDVTFDDDDHAPVVGNIAMVCAGELAEKGVAVVRCTNPAATKSVEQSKELLRMMGGESYELNLNGRVIKFDLDKK